MLLAIDIGNTSINNGIFRGKALKRKFRIASNAKGLQAEYAKRLRAYSGKIDGVVIASVAPEVFKRVKKALKKFRAKNILVVGQDIDSGVKNLYKNPKQVGQDRLVNARAAYELYGGASIIVDFGTAITIDVVNKNKEYVGGVIAPGVEISLNALSEKAYLLPRVDFSPKAYPSLMKKARVVLGKETRESMIKGAIYGFSGLCDGIVWKLKKKYCKGGRVVATGGMSPLMGPYCESVDRIDPDLTLNGLGLIGAENV